MKPCMPSSLRSPIPATAVVNASQSTTPSSRVSPSTILLPTGVYGPGDKDYLIALQSIARGINAMSGLRKQYLTFVYGGDVARAALFVLRDERARGQRYIVADGDTYTDREFGHLAQRLLGRKHVFHIRIPLPLVRLTCLFGSLRAAITGQTTPLNRDKYPILAQRNWRCDPSPLFALGFTPSKNLEEGLRETIARRAPPRSPPIVIAPA